MANVSGSADEAVILSAVRTPFGRYGGALSSVRPDDLAAVAIVEALRRAGVERERIEADLEDVVLGCAACAGCVAGRAARADS